MSVVDLLEPVLTGGILNTNFFNGRLLAAEDLQTEQLANRKHLRQLGAALGDGVVSGYETSIAAESTTDRPVLRVMPGLALNRNGDPVALNSEARVALAPSETVDFGEAGLFAVCAPPGPVTTNPGLYLLTVAPASGFSGRAPLIELGSDGIASTCASRYSVEGVKFAMTRITLPASPAAGSLAAIVKDAITRFESAVPAPGADPLANGDLSLIRNGLAYLCFGSEALEAAAKKPLDRLNDPSHGLLDDLRQGGQLTDCEVPFALIYWRPLGLQFLDVWGARRPAAPRPLRRRAEGAAMFRQFQKQTAELFASGLNNTALSSIQATRNFRYLPPAGVLPMARPGVRGFAPEAFFYNIPHRDIPQFIDGAVLDSLIFESFQYEPVDLAQPEMVWVYQVWQNALARDNGENVQPCLVFTSAHVPYLGPSRFDVARWDYANFSGCCGDGSA